MASGAHSNASKPWNSEKEISLAERKITDSNRDTDNVPQ